MAAEDYDDVPGLGDGSGRPWAFQKKPSTYECRFCGKPITFVQRKAYEPGGGLHRCQRDAKAGQHSHDSKPPEQATLFAMAAMNAIINGQIQAGGVDFIHSMNFHDVADAAWRIAAAMVHGEKNYQDGLPF